MQNECKWALKECKIPVSLYLPLLPANTSCFRNAHLLAYYIKSPESTNFPCITLLILVSLWWNFYCVSKYDLPNTDTFQIGRNKSYKLFCNLFLKLTFCNAWWPTEISRSIHPSVNKQNWTYYLEYCILAAYLPLHNLTLAAQHASQYIAMAL
jgi:hypothetical protein